MGDETFPATVINVIDDYRIVINKGSREGIKIGQRFLIYNETKEMLRDPITLEDLGYLEISRGTGKVIHVQEKLATLESDRITAPSKRIIKRSKTTSPSPISGIAGYLSPSPVEVVEEIIETPEERSPFDSASKGDRVKPI